jgi:predicted RND superfamily exporter protein
MLLGLGIDYGSYFIARFEEEQAAMSGMPQALVRAFVTTGPGIAATALTTVFTFGPLLLSAPSRTGPWPMCCRKPSARS